MSKQKLFLFGPNKTFVFIKTVFNYGGVVGGHQQQSHLLNLLDVRVGVDLVVVRRLVAVVHPVVVGGSLSEGFRRSTEAVDHRPAQKFGRLYEHIVLPIERKREKEKAN